MTPISAVTSSRWCAALSGLALVLLAGCAGDRAYRSGMQGLEQGRYEEAVSKLEEAARADPGNLEFRSAVHSARERAVRQLLAEAVQHERTGRLDPAETAYRRLLTLEPDNARARAGLDAIAKSRRHAPLLQQANKLFQDNDPNAALGKVRQILAENPNHAEAATLQQKIEERQVRDAHAPLKLKSRYVRPVSLQFRDANIRQVFEALSKTTAINFIFDNDVKNGLKVTIFVNQVSVEDAIDLILAQSQLAQKILNDNTVLIYPATPQKQKEYQEQIVKSFYLTNIEPKKAQTLLKTMLDAGTTFIDEKSNLLILRDTPEVVRMAEKLFASTDLPEPEVMLEVEVLEIKRSTLQQLGLDYPDAVTFSATNAAGGTDNLTLADLDNIEKSTVKVSPLSIGLDIAKQNSDANVLASPRIRARNREKARIHIGDRVPVITNTQTPLATGASVVTGSVQYLDVGLKLEIEPVVHLDNDVAIKLTLEVSSIVKEITNAQPGSAGTVAYQIGTRNAATLLRLRDGETQVLAGLISDEERVTSNKIPGVGDLPVVGRLFATQKDDLIKTEIVLSITPRLVRNLVRPDAATTEFWYGSESRRRGKPLTIQSVSRGEPLVVPATPPAVAPAAAPVPPVEPVEPDASPAPAAPTSEPPPAGGSATPVPLTLQGPDRVTVGQEFEVVLSLKAEQPLAGLALQLGYEPAVFEVVSVGEGSFVRQASSSDRFGLQVDRTAGRIGIRVAPGEGKGFAGEADVVTVTFRAVAARPQSSVTMHNVTLTAPGGGQVAAAVSEPLALVASPN
jgi:general secretion pathway protein D